MYLTSDLKPSNDFTMIMNEVIFNDDLTHAEFRLWCRLLAVRKGSKGVKLEVEEIAKAVGVSPSFFRAQRQSLKDKGYLTSTRSELIVTVPGKDFKPKETKPTPAQQLRHDLREAWNKTKPDAYSKLRHPLSEAQVETLRAHAQHNGEDDLCKFLGAVLKGCKADDWWKEKNLSFNNVFGTGTPKQNKFTNVEKLLKLSSSKKGQAALFDENDDKCWLDWYATKGHEMTKVVRLEKEQYDAWEHQIETIGDNVLYVYTHEGRLVHWTMKEGQHGVSYLPTAR